jgi:hypothetical protein
MAKSLWREHLLPVVALAGLGVAINFVDHLVLEKFQLVWIERYSGIVGVALILLSMMYSLRKRKVFLAGTPKRFLEIHEVLAWTGAVTVLVHAGAHFNTLLPWLATFAVVVATVSGLVGNYLLGKAKQHVQIRRQYFLQQGLSEAEVEQALFWDATTLEVMGHWRKIHIPIVIVLSLLVTAHVVSVLFFWSES